MFEALKGTGVYPKRAVFCTCYSRDGGYWYVVASGAAGEKHCAPPALLRGKVLVMRLSADLSAKVEPASPGPGNGRHRLCYLVDPDGTNLHVVSVEASAMRSLPGPEASAERIAEILNACFAEEAL